jgi:hypothetical protein
MKLYNIKSDSCTNTKTIAILEIGNRALLGSYFGYLSIGYRNFPTEFQFTHIDKFDVCDLNQFTLSKIDNFLNTPLSFTEKIKYYTSFKAFKQFCKTRPYKNETT